MNAYELRKIILEAVPEGIEAAHTEHEHRYRRQDVCYDSVTTKLGRIDKSYLKKWAVNQGIDVVREGLKAIEQGGNESVEQLLERGRTAHVDVLRQASEDGTAVHKALEGYLDDWIETGIKPEGCLGYAGGTGSDAETNSSIISALRSAEKFFGEYELIPVLSEFTVWNDRYQIAGTCDALFIWFKVYKDKKGDEACEHHYEENEGNPKRHWCLKCPREVEAKLIIADWKSSNSIQKDDYAWQITAYKYGLEKATKLKIDDSWVIRFSKHKQEYQILKVNNSSKALKEFALISKLDALIKDREWTHGKLLEPITKPTIITL